MQSQFMSRFSRVLNEGVASVERLGQSITNQQQSFRSKHSSTQVKRLFKKNPARLRVDSRLGINKEPHPLPESKYQAILEPKMLPNGWCALPGTDVEVPAYPFKVARTKNKPNDGVGFLPVYSEFRKDGAKVTTRIKKVSGDRDTFLSELRAVLQMPESKNPKDDPIRIRTGGTIEIKGNRVREVKYWLASLGL